MSTILSFVVACWAICSGPACKPDRPPPKDSEEAAGRVGQEAHPVPTSPTTQPAAQETRRDPLAEVNEQARGQIARVMATASLPGAEGFEARRAALVGRAKSDPVFFIREPAIDPASPRWLQAQRTRLESTDFPWRELKTLLKKYRRDPDGLRTLLLPDGYLFSDKPDLAFSLVSLLKPRHLFSESSIWVQRGELLMRATRGTDGDYRYADGPEKGRVVRLLHLDRVGTGTEVPRPLHRDFRSLRYRLYFERARVKHITEEHLVAELKYGEDWVTTLLKADGARLQAVAEVIPPERFEALQSARARLRLRAHLIARLRDAMRSQIEEALPFDEPKTEEGQQDGSLRPEWLRAYARGDTTFEFNEDRYRVFDRAGRPRPPQVCIDFMTDTLERASGTWWAPRSSPQRQKLKGGLTLSDIEGLTLRRTQSFLRFAQATPDWFEVTQFPESERIELGYKERFFEWVAARVELFEAGDMVFIRGPTPWDEVDEHTHSFYIYETDPLTGMPIAIAGNAGPANLWSLETEARRTPHRTLRDRVRLRTAWLETFLTVDVREPLSAPPLVTSR